MHEKLNEKLKESNEMLKKQQGSIDKSIAKLTVLEDAMEKSDKTIGNQRGKRSIYKEK